MYKNILLSVAFCIAFGLGLAQNHELVIVHTNDTHSQIEPFTAGPDSNVGGALRREALLCELRSQHPELLLLDAGDFSQGTPFFNVFKGYTEIKLMNEMHYDACALGNHEFDFGSQALAKRLKSARFPALCANYSFKNKALAKVVKQHTVIKRGGLKIGLFGLLVDLQPLVMESVYKELVYLDPIEAARKQVDALKNEGCDLIICLSHLGITSNKVNDFILAEQVPEIDLIVGGHSHSEMAQPKIVSNTRICQMAGKGKCVGVVTLTY